MRPWTALVPCSLLLVACAGGTTSRVTPPTTSPLTVTSSPEIAPLVETRHWNLGPVADIAVGQDSVYLLYSPPTSEGALANSTDTRLARIDRASGVVVTVGPFPFARHIALAGSVLWIGPNNQYQGTSAPDSRMLVGVDARTLDTLQKLTLPAESSQTQLVANLASDSNSVWVAYGSHIYRMAAAGGRTLASRSIDGIATGIALEPAGRRLYVAIDGLTAAVSATITEFDAATLQPLVSAATGGAGLGGPQVAAGANDLWVSYATGMLGQVEHRQASNLAELPIAFALHSNGVHVFQASGIVWVIDTMAGELICLDPETGAARATWATREGGVVAGDGTGTYFGDIMGVGSLQPDARCR